MEMTYFISGVALGAILILIFWLRCDKKLKLVDDFSFTEDQKCMIKEIINLYYNPDNCDICNRYREVHKETILEPPFKNCSARKDIKALKEARESNEKMFEEIEKIIRR